MWEDYFSPYYKAFRDIHKYETRPRQFGLASMALVTASVAAKEDKEDPLPIVALDLAGAEKDYEASWHKEAYGYAHRKFLNKVCYCLPSIVCPQLFALKCLPSNVRPQMFALD